MFSLSSMVRLFVFLFIFIDAGLHTVARHHRNSRLRTSVPSNYEERKGKNI